MNAMMKQSGQVIRKLHDLGAKNGTESPEFVPPKGLSNEKTAWVHDQFKWVWEYHVATLGQSHFSKRRDTARKKLDELGVTAGRENVAPGVASVLWAHAPMQLEYKRNANGSSKTDLSVFIAELRKRGVGMKTVEAAQAAAQVEAKPSEFFTVVQMGE